MIVGVISVGVMTVGVLSVGVLNVGVMTVGVLSVGVMILFQFIDGKQSCLSLSIILGKNFVWLSFAKHVIDINEYGLIYI
jgi:hypothetical protein